MYTYFRPQSWVSSNIGNLCQVTDKMIVLKKISSKIVFNRFTPAKAVISKNKFEGAKFLKNFAHHGSATLAPREHSFLGGQRLKFSDDETIFPTKPTGVNPLIMSCFSRYLNSQRIIL